MEKQREFSESGIARNLGQILAQRLVLSCIRYLQRLQDNLLSGDDTTLQSIWEEICVQQQGEESYEWHAYLDVISTFLEARVEGLQRYELDALWLLTDQGDDWSYESTEEREHYPVSQGDVTEYLLSKVILEATNWSNARIRKYLERDYDEDY